MPDPSSRGHGGNVVADEVFHHHVGKAGRVAQRPAGDGADVLLELVGDADRFGPVAGIVDARGDLVDDQRAVGEREELDAEDADIVERVGDGGGVLAGEVGGGGGDGRGNGGGCEDAVAVDVLGGVEGGESRRRGRGR